MVMETLLQAIRDHVHIRGVKTENNAIEYINVAYADDLLIMVSNPVEAFPHLLALFEEYGKDWYLIHLQLTVTDVNDESPQWTMQPYPFLATVSPLATAGTYVYKLHAIDKDEGINGEVEYFLLEGGDTRFEVDRSTGWIQTTGQVLEEGVEYLLTAQAADIFGKKSPPVLVSVIAGERPPQFTNISYIVYVPENTPAGHVLLAVTARSHQNRPLSYSLVSNPYNLFSINQQSGDIRLTRSVDFETEPSQFLLLVRASEDWRPLSSSVEVVVVIIDINDCTPEFQQTIYSRDGVPETVPVATSLLQVTATDCDSGVNGEFSYFTLSPDFNISAQGTISPARRLDYERPSHLYEFVILAIDHGESPNTATATVRIRVTNVNDEAPEFSQTIYRTFVSEDAAPNTLVATVQAFDPDGDRVTYEISGGNGEGNFLIDPQKGLIRLGSSPLPRLHGTEYVLYVTATDDNLSGGPHSLTSTTTVMVRVDDINNNKPIFYQCSDYSKNASVLENQPLGTFVLQVEAKDADSGVNGQVKYGIMHREGSLPAFTIHPETGVITTLQSFDREREKEYPLTIKATDQSTDPLIGLCQINIAILDQNDNDPSFENNRYEYFLKEDTPVGTSFLRIAAHDEDYGTNAALSYSVTGDELPVFQINGTTGWLYVNQPLLRKSLITQEVIVTDGGNRSTRVEVVIRVTNAQNQPPIWEKERYEIVIPENTLRDTPIVTVKARSLLGDPRVTYNLEEGLVPESNMPVRFYLTMNREDGSASVLVAENLDYETTKNFVLKIRAQNVAAVPLAAFTTVYINITDVNDNVPFFSSSIYEASVTEGLDLGTLVLQVSASDQDLGLNGKITYSILEDRSGDHALFHIDPQTGSIYTAAVFDREEKTSYLLEVKSADGSESARPGKHGQPNSDTAYVRIFILDVNDNQPSFTQRAYFVSVDEDQDVGYVAVTVSASDPDEGMNANIRYQITAGNIGGVLDLNPETGAILIVHPLDYEEVKVYVLTLLVSDGKWEDFATVTINVLNKNDEPPVFSLNEYRGSVTEELAELPVFVLQVSATDPDRDQPGGLKYSLHGSGAEDIFTIDEKTGSIFAMKPLDREEHAIWRFVVLATDDEGDGLTGFTDVVIYVQDINDNTPQFICSFNMCNASVVEHAPPNTPIMEMSAVDLDDKNDGLNAILTYSILSNPYDELGVELFNINHNTGTIYTAKGNLDREKNDSFLVLVEVKDGGGLSSTATATITILDTNDHAPKFTQETWIAAILETTEVNSTVLQVFAVDEDIGDNSLLTFSILEGDPDQKFFIENRKKKHQADIKLKKKLDYESPQERWFNLRIKVEDKDFSSISQCVIELHDANDNPPVFSPSLMKVDPFYENITIGTIIANVNATDGDSGKNGQIIYSILPDSDSLEEFFVDQAGSIMVSKSLDREVQSAYSLVILATDEGSPAQTGTMTVLLNLLDVNDNGPIFDGIYLPVVWENTNFPEIVRLNDSSYLLHAVDLDSPENGPPFSFSLPLNKQNSTDFQLVDHGDNTASIQTLRVFDREQEKEFHLCVVITDSGRPPMSATNTLTITIGDENDHGHKAGHKEVYIYVHGESRSPVDVGKVFAPDEDDWDNKTFTAISEMPAHFHLDNNTGNLQLAEQCGQGTYNLKVKVSDGVWPDVVSTMRIHVKEIPSDAIYNSVSVILANVTAEEFIVKDNLGVSKEERLRRVLAEVIPARPDNVQIFSLRGEGRLTEVRLTVLGSSSSHYKAEKLQSLIVTHRDEEVTFTLDRCSAAIIVEKEGIGKRLLSEDRTGCEVGGVMTKEWRVWNPHHVLWLGGIRASSPPDSTQIHFKGCLRNLTVNKEMYDLGAPIESVGSSPGCAACDAMSSASCETKSPCTAESGASSSSQQECEKDAAEYFFQSGSFIQYKFSHALHTQRTHFQTMVRTRQPNSIILSVSSQDQTEYIILQVTHGMLAVSYNIGDGDFVVRLPNHRVDSGEWQEIALERMQNEFSLRVNGGGEDREITAAHGTYKEIKVDPSSIVLGSGNLHALSFQGKRPKGFIKSTIGCIKDAKLNNYKLPMGNQSSTSVSIIRKHALIAGAVLFSHCNKKRRLNEGVYHVSAYKDEPEDTRQNIFHYNEEGGGEEDQDAFSMTDLQLSLRSSPAQSLCRRMREQHINGPLSCDYDMSDSQKDAAYMRASCDSLKVYDTEGTGSLAGSLSTLASSGLDSDLEYEDVRTWGPKFSYLCKLYSYTEDDDP
ncbi:neural-cadherin-like [Bufo bufo]|uniref:neural-cadherin-like n=1 Tax=Bufo bufo TaxID=8384 RepID=UPI001ABDEAC2|nr:neural-cadherin-like [Bufo bufo]